MVSRRLVLLLVLPMLIVVSVASPCLCARFIAASKGEAVSAVDAMCPLCFCFQEAQDTDTPATPQAPRTCDCATRSADLPPREAPMPPAPAPTLFADHAPASDVAPASIDCVPLRWAAIAPPDTLRRGTVLLR